MHVDNAAIASPNSDLETSVPSPRPIDEEPAVAVHTAHITEATIAKQPFALTAGNSSASAEIGANADVDIDIGLGACLRRKRQW